MILLSFFSKIILIIFFTSELLWAQIQTYSNETYPSEITGHKKNTVQIYLAEHFEEDRKVFSLFRVEDHKLQDLIWQRSYSSHFKTEINQLRKQLLKQYQLKPINELNLNLSDRAQTLGHSFNSSSDFQQKDAPTLWIATKEWNAQWEQEFGNWVGTNFSAHFMSDYNLATDCADVAYTLRWIFARIHKLPMASRLGGSGQLFTNESMKKEWDKLPTHEDWHKDQRFLQALKYILNNTYTHTLMKDSYPVGINTTDLTPGTHHLQLYESSGHTMIVDSVNAPNKLPITMLYSTVPQTVRELMSTFFQAYESPELYKSGFYKIRWVQKKQDQWVLLDAKSIPGYSEKQFHLNTDDTEKQTPYFLKVYRLLNPNFSFQMMLEQSLKELETRIRDRIQIVEAGFQFCQSNNCAPGSAGDEDWSTPSRDKRLMQLHDSLNIATQMLNQTEPELYQKWIPLLLDFAQKKQFDIAHESFSLSQIITALLHQLAQSDPRVSVTQRWGVRLESYLNNFIDSLKNAVAERKILIDEAQVCRKNYCKVTSASFTKLSTLKLDQRIRNQSLGISKLCQLEDFNSCEKMMQTLEQSQLQNKNLHQWIEESHFWMSNPNRSTEKRWNVSGLKIPAEQKSSAHFREDLKWFKLDKKLWQTRPLQNILFDPAEELGQLHQTGDFFFTYQKKDQNLKIIFYRLPRQKWSEIIIPLNTNEAFRIWWSGPKRETLSIFGKEQFFEVNPNGQILQSRHFQNAFAFSGDQRITLITDQNQFYLSDAAVDASSFFSMEISTPELKKFQFVERTKNGYSFGSWANNRWIYFERSTENKMTDLLIDWKTDNYFFPYIEPLARWAVRMGDPGKSILIFQRKQSSDQRDSYQLIKKIPGKMFSGINSVLTVYTDTKKQSFSLEKQDYLTWPCLNPNAQSELLAPDYYSCWDKNLNSLHHSSGKLLLQQPFEESMHWWLSTNGKNNYLSMYQFSETNPIVEFFSILPESIDGPIIQIEPDFESETLNLPFGSTDGFSSEVAPAPFTQGQFTNYGHIVKIPEPRSYLLNKIIGATKQKVYLFIPE
jgi:hypothetical protein